jgi:hypothetical protein
MSTGLNIFIPLNQLIKLQHHMKYLSIFVFVIAISISFTNYTTAQHSNDGKAASHDNRRMLLRDEGLSQLSYIDIAKPEKNWFVKVPTGRDIQLDGNGRVLIGTGNGFEEYEITTGKKVNELNTFPGTVSTRRLKNGNILLAGVNWQGKQGIVLVEVDQAGSIQKKIVYPGFNYVRLVRETTPGNFLVTADETVFEGNIKGDITWRATVTGLPKPHAWQAVRLANGHTIVSSGYAKNFQIFDAGGNLVDSITGPAAVHPNFYAGFQILGNGNYVVTNWQGHGPGFGASGKQVLEYSPNGQLVWSWKQDPEKFSSLQAVIVLDGLDLNKVYIDNF